MSFIDMDPNSFETSVPPTTEITPEKQEYPIPEKFIQLQERIKYLDILHQRNIWIPKNESTEKGFFAPKNKTPHLSAETLKKILAEVGFEEFSEAELIEQTEDRIIRRDRGCFEGENPFIGDYCGHNNNEDGSISHNRYEPSGDSITIEKTVDGDTIITRSEIIDAEGHGVDASAGALLAKVFFSEFHKLYHHKEHEAMVAFDTFIASLAFDPNEGKLEYGYSFIELKENKLSKETEFSFLQAGSGFFLILEETPTGEYHISLFGNDPIQSSDCVEFLKMPEEKVDGHWIDYGMAPLIGLGRTGNTELEDAKPFTRTYTNRVRVIHASDGIVDIITREDEKGHEILLEDHLHITLEEILKEHTRENIDEVAMAICDKLQEIHLNPNNKPKDDYTAIALNLDKSNLQ